MLSHKKGKEQNGRKEQHKFGELDVSSMRKYHSFIRSLVHSFIPFIHTCQLNHQLIEFIQITNDEVESPFFTRRCRDQRFLRRKRSSEDPELVGQTNREIWSENASRFLILRMSYQTSPCQASKSFQHTVKELQTGKQFDCHPRRVRSMQCAVSLEASPHESEVVQISGELFL
ncbi:hypothetical protein RB195_017877 [Necator americanus]|uniref:Uncharacterized protein n=1 Tax=Necator americanus TaxID=51031 RepID=A0ABR1C997_NECAM